MDRPKLSIGVPVYNGQRYLEQALSSLVGQTFTDFELILCDNASTDNTGKICESFAARDSRIRYYRNAKNIGANPNFNRALELATGEYFKWAAYDDICLPTYLEKCIAALEADPSATLAHTRTAIIDEASKRIDLDPQSLAARGITLKQIQDPPRRFDSNCASTRYADVLLRTKWVFEIFSVFRTAQLRSTGGMGDFYGTDKVLLANLALQGKFIEIDEDLFLRRNHAEQSSQMKTAAQRAAWSGASKPAGILVSQRKCLAGYRRAISVAPLRMGQKLACHAVLLRYLLQFNKYATLLGFNRGRGHAMETVQPTWVASRGKQIVD